MHQDPNDPMTTGGSEVRVSDGATSFSGGPAVDLFVAMTLRRGLMAAKIGLRVNRGWTNKKMFAKASEFTGKKYKRGQYDEAVADLTKIIEIAKAMTPVRRV